MSCFCHANLNLLPSLNLNAQFNLSASATAAMGLFGQLGMPLPFLALPAFPLPTLPPINLSAVAALTGVATLMAQAPALGINLSLPIGALAMARLSATVSARLNAILALNINFAPWIQLAMLNTACLNLTAAFNAMLNIGVPGFNFLPPLNWNLPMLPSLTALLSVCAQMNLSLNASLIASLMALLGSLQLPPMNLSAMASLTAGVSAFASLNASLGLNPLTVPFPAIQAAVAANFSAMAALAAQLGINFGLPLPALPAIPGFVMALTASVSAQLSAAMNVSAMLALPTLALPTGPLLAASLSLGLSAVLGVNFALPGPCPICDLSAVMAAL